MSKKRNRNRSARRYRQTTPPCESFEQQATEYANYLRFAHKRMGWTAITREGFDLDPVRLQRRIKAAANLRDDFHEHLDRMGLDFNGSTNRVWLQTCLPTTAGLDSIDFSMHILLGASIWILDRLAECGQFTEACKLFPTDPTVYDEMYYPEIHDLCHEERAILGTLWILQHRNDDCTGLEVSSFFAGTRTMMDDYTASLMHHQNVPSRNRFEQLMSLIPQQWIDEARDDYLEQYHDVANRLLLSYSHHYNRRDQLESNLFAVNSSALAAIQQAYADSQEAKRQLEAIVQAQTIPDFTSTQNSYTHKLQSCSLYGQGSTLEDQISEVDAKIIELTGRICVFHTLSDEKQEKTFTPEVRNIWEGLTIGNPYALCFACLYLLEQDSDLPWIYGVNSNLMGFCAHALPWFLDYDPHDQNAWDLIDPVEHIEEDPISLYNTYFTDRARTKTDYATRFNLPQIIYRHTGYVLPRNFYEPLESALLLERFSIVDEPLRTEMLTTLYMILAHANRTLIPAYAPQQMSNTQDPDTLLRRIQELEAERKALRQEAYEAGRNAKQLQEELRAMQVTNERTRLELSDLRELVFSLSNVETVDTTPCDISFPQHTSKNILVFGGHPSWYNEIKAKLPDVRFFRQEAKPDRQMIRNADEIWLQTNAMSHPLYDTVTDCARAHNIPIRYFRFASATKCAEQLIVAQSA